MSDKVIVRRFPIRQAFAVFLLFTVLTACAAREGAENRVAPAPGFSSGQEAEMPGGPPVFREEMMAAEDEGQLPGATGGMEALRPDEPGYELGVRIIGVRFLSAGYMLDFRYEVVEPEKSRPIFDRNVIPYLVHEKSGARFAVPNPAKVGPLRATTLEPEAGKKYYIMFANPGRYVKEGDLVTVVVGEHRFEHLAVQ